MAYNKAREELKWLLWKTAEEKQMRELGVSEDLIQELHIYDWKMFKSERKYYTHIQEAGDYLETLAATEDQPNVRDVDDLLNEIDDPELLKALLRIDRFTLRIVLLRMNGFSAKQISEQLGIAEENVWVRLSRLRKKLKKFSNE